MEIIGFKRWLEVIDAFGPDFLPTNPERYPWNRKTQNSEEEDPRELNNPMKHGPGNENPTNAFPTGTVAGTRKDKHIPPARMKKKIKS
jgi:hypothetical protein